MRKLSWYVLPICLMWAATAAAADPAQGYSGYAPYSYPYAGSYQADPPPAIPRPEAIEAPRAEHGLTPAVPPTQSHAPDSYHNDTYAEGSLLYGGGGGGCADESCYGGWMQGLGNWRHGWYGSVAGLIMTRDLPNRKVLTSDVTWPELNLMDNRDAGVDWEGGFEVTFGKCLGCNSRVEVGYWTLEPFSGSAEVWDPAGNLVSPMDMQNVWLTGDEAWEFFDNASGHAIYRRNEVHNVEMNFYYRPCSLAGHGQSGYGCGYGGCGECGGCADCGNCCQPSCRWNVELLAGVRYFKFDEYFGYAGLEGGADWGDLGGQRELYISSDVENNLIGFQIGALIDYYVTKRWSVYARPKVGIYGNHMRHDFRVYRGNNADTGWNSVTGQDYPVSSTKNDFSILAELDLGMRWDVTCHWSAFASYRVVAASGIALADEQLPYYLADMNGVADIDSNNSLLLHGVVLGLQYAY